MRRFSLICYKAASQFFLCRKLWGPWLNVRTRSKWDESTIEIFHAARSQALQLIDEYRATRPGANIWEPFLTTEETLIYATLVFSTFILPGMDAAR